MISRGQLLLHADDSLNHAVCSDTSDLLPPCSKSSDVHIASRGVQYHAKVENMLGNSMHKINGKSFAHGDISRKVRKKNLTVKLG